MGSFDRIHPAILMKLVKRRIADARVHLLIENFLQAGILDNGLFQETSAGVPQGGVLSPLLSNLYLNELDQWWWRKFGSRSTNEKRRNRNAGNGNAILTRYADDFCVLWNGGRDDAIALRNDLRRFLWDELHLELSEDKTCVTHLNDGIDFLGFHLRREQPPNNRPWLRVTPTLENVRRFRARVKALTVSTQDIVDIENSLTSLTCQAKFNSGNR